MKQVIDGLTYNTETATEIGFGASSGTSRSDFRFYEETLYKTRKGRFFLCGEGGPMTRWAQGGGGARWAGSGIQALSTDEALDWCERHDIDADVIAEHFELEDA